MKFKINKVYLIPIFVRSNLDIKKINFNSILKLLKYYKVNSLRIDNINSNYQKEDMSRLFMFDISNLNDGLKLKDLIRKILV